VVGEHKQGGDVCLEIGVDRGQGELRALAWIQGEARGNTRDGRISGLPWAWVRRSARREVVLVVPGVLT
jgi:hypothetical protein